MKNKLLSPREKDVLRLIMQEYSSSEIADELKVSRRTIETVRENIMRKTQMPNIVALVKYMLKNKILK